MILTSALLLGDDGTGTGGFVGGSEDIALPNFPLNFYFTKADYLDGVVALGDNVYKEKQIVNPNAYPIFLFNRRAPLITNSGLYYDVPIVRNAWNWKNRKGGTSSAEVTWFDLSGVDYNSVGNFFGSSEDIKCAFAWRRPVSGKYISDMNFIAGGGSLLATLALYKGSKATPIIMPALTETLYGWWGPYLPGYNFLETYQGAGYLSASRFAANGTVTIPGVGVAARADISFDAATDKVTATVIPLSANYTNPTATEDFTPLMHAPVRFTGSGTLPAPLVKDVTYYMEPTDVGKFKLRTAPDPDVATINLTSSTTSGSIKMLCAFPGGAATLTSGEVFYYGWQANAIKEDFR